MTANRKRAIRDEKFQYTSDACIPTQAPQAMLRARRKREESMQQGTRKGRTTKNLLTDTKFVRFIDLIRQMTCRQDKKQHIKTCWRCVHEGSVHSDATQKRSMRFLRVHRLHVNNFCREVPLVDDLARKKIVFCIASPRQNRYTVIFSSQISKEFKNPQVINITEIIPVLDDLY